VKSFFLKNDNKTILEKLISQANDGIFRKRTFKFDGCRNKFAPIYNFFRVQIKFKNRPTGNLKFVCIVCEKDVQAELGEPTNLHKHLAKHEPTIEWLELYRQRDKIAKFDFIDEDTMLLIKFFITSNVSTRALKNDALRELLRKHKIPLYSEDTFVDKYLPAVMTKLHKRIESKLQLAVNVVLIADCWSNKQMLSFIGVAVNIAYENFTNECVVIGFELMTGKNDHMAIKSGIEKVLNKYDFDKSKVTGTLKINELT
jgi:hypothetical protein